MFNHLELSDTLYNALSENSIYNYFNCVDKSALPDLLTNKAASEPQLDFSSVELLRQPIDVEQQIREKISQQTEDNAFFIVNLSDIIRKKKQWNNCLPRVEPFYAVKCNPDIEIIKCLAVMGVNFDCASRGEIDLVMSIGVTADRIIYANPCKPKAHLNYAREVGVNMSVFDGEAELYKIKECHPNCKLLMRIATDDRNSMCAFSVKFGARENQWQRLLNVAKSLDLQVIGVSFHVGSGCSSLDTYESSLRSAHRVFQMGEELGFSMNLLDIGGGFPGSWSAMGDDGSGITFSKITSTMNPLLDQLFPRGRVRLIGEPGRYMVASSHTLAVSVIGVRKFEVELACDGTSATGTPPGSPDTRRSGAEHSNAFKFSYYVNDGVYGSFNNIMFDHAHPQPVLLEKRPSAVTYNATMFGPTCDSLDCIGKDMPLPELNVGEWIYFPNMGAYTKAAASAFNGFALSKCYYVCSTEL